MYSCLFYILLHTKQPCRGMKKKMIIKLPLILIQLRNSREYSKKFCNYIVHPLHAAGIIISASIRYDSHFSAPFIALKMHPINI